MTDDLPPVTQADLEQHLQLVRATLETFDERQKERYDRIEELVDSTDQKIAAIAMATGEHTAILDSIMSWMRETFSEEEFKEFEKIILRARKNLLEILESATDAMAATDPGVAAALAEMAKQNKAD